jgi:hypothetical protein
MQTLLGVSERVSGSLTWDPGHPREQLLLARAKTGGSQFSFASDTGGPQVINVNLSGAAGFQAPGFVGREKRFCFM